jgi:transcriptional regulator with XRE-family HTH domain
MEKIENLKRIIKTNLIKYRKAAGLTQAQLAEKLGYSDKSVSKWEREEGVPDIYILKEIADLYGITVNDLLSENQTMLQKAKSLLPKISKRNKILIALLSAGLVWAIATTLYVSLDLALPSIENYLTNIYIYAIPASCIVLIVFNSIWGKKYINFILISALIWTFTLALFVSLPIKNIGKLFIIPIPLQILTLLWFMLERKNKTSQQ